MFQGRQSKILSNVGKSELMLNIDIADHVLTLARKSMLNKIENAEYVLLLAEKNTIK